MAVYCSTLCLPCPSGCIIVRHSFYFGCIILQWWRDQMCSDPGSDHIVIRLVVAERCYLRSHGQSAEWFTARVESATHLDRCVCEHYSATSLQCAWLHQFVYSVYSVQFAFFAPTLTMTFTVATVRGGWCSSQNSAESIPPGDH